MVTTNNMGPGALLQAAREQKKMNQSDVAKQLRLSLQWIKDIENDDYTHGAALIYVRGYLRSYARLVGMSVDAIISAFERLDLEDDFIKAKNAEEKTILQPTVPVIAKSSRFSSRRMIRWASAIAIFILFVLVALWWQGQRKHSVGQTQAQPVLTLQPQPATIVSSNKSKKK